MYNICTMSSPRYPHRKGTTPPKKEAKAASNSAGGVAAFRMDYASTAESGTPLRTAAVVGPFFTPDSQARFESRLQARFATVASDRPVAAVVAQSAAGSPTVVATPGGSQMSRSLRLGAASFFSNRGGGAASATAVDEADIDPAFFESVAYKAVRDIRTATKKIREKTITEAELLRVSEAYRARGYRRLGPSQNRAMAASASSTRSAGATGYARATNLFEGDVRWEWLHLIAHAIEGPDSQFDGNLVAGKVHANTAMMLVEEQIRFLASQYPKGFTLEVTADLVPDTHIATSINYVIKTDDFTLQFEFDGLNDQKPHAAFRKYMREFLREFVESKKVVDKENRSDNQPR